MSLRIGSVIHKQTAMQLLVKATSGSGDESTSAKSELVKSAVEQAAQGNWESAAEYATAAYTANVVTPDELIQQISSSIVAQAPDAKSDEDSQAKTEGSTSTSHGRGDKFSIPHLKDLKAQDPSLAVFAVREELIRLARSGNESILTLFNRSPHKEAEK